MEIDSLISKSRALIDLPRGRTKHFSFLLRKNKVLSIGWNQADKTHPAAVKYGYRYPFLHSELHCLIAYTGKLDELQRCVLVNIRFGKRGDVRMSKPCECCQHVIRAFRIGETFYTNTCGGVSQL